MKRLIKESKYLAHIILMLAIDMLVINQILRFGTLPESISITIYGYSLLASCLIMVWVIFRECSYKIERFQLILLFLFMLIGFMGFANSNAFSVILASEAGLLAFSYGHITGHADNDIYVDLRHFNLLQWIVMSYFVVIEIIENFTKIIQARSDVIAANNMIYYGFPLLLLFKNKRISAPEILLTVFIVIASAFSFKRTTLIAVIISLAVYYITRLKTRVSSAKKIILIPTFILAMVAIVRKIDEYSGGHITKRFSDISATGGNNRTEIWSGTIEAIKNSSFVKLFFGHGFNSVKELMGFSAHNDYIEIAYDFGVIGLLIYILANCYVLSCVVKARKRNMDEYPVFITTYIAFVTLSLFSHVYLYAFVSIPFLMFMGYLCQKVQNGLIDKEKE